MRRRLAIDRRSALAGLLGAGGVMVSPLRLRADEAPLRFALTPVLLTSDLVMLEELKTYLTRAWVGLCIWSHAAPTRKSPLCC